MLATHDKHASSSDDLLSSEGRLELNIDSSYVYTMDESLQNDKLRRCSLPTSVNVVCFLLLNAQCLFSNKSKCFNTD